jgi:hypothetical protein
VTKRVIIQADCNACDTPNIDGQETIAFSFALDNIGYTMDLCQPHADQYRQTLEPWRARADVTQGGSAKKSSSGGVGSGSPPQGGPVTSALAEGLDPKQVREWARANGWDVPEVGRLNMDVINAYKAAHGLGLGSPTPEPAGTAG